MSVSVFHAHPFRDGEAVMWRNRFLLLFDRVQSALAVCRTDGTILLANPAMAAEWGAPPSKLCGHNALELFRPREPDQMRRLAEALRLGHRSRYPVGVGWSTDGCPRSGEVTVVPVSETSQKEPALLLQLRVREPDSGPAAPADEGLARVSAIEADILAHAAAGATTASIAGSVGLTVDGVNYHLSRLSRRWQVPNRPALVARAYVLGVLEAGVWPPHPVADALS
ncbi:hypothetical protein GCM10027091_50440 [Streptomyces daliensis]